MKIQSIKLGIACASTGSIMYIGCAILMLILGHDGSVWFFNSILHGFDVETIMTMNVEWPNMISGILLTALLAGFSGWIAGNIYNLILKSDVI